MFSKDKIEIRFYKFINYLVYHSLFWIISFWFFIFLIPNNYLTQTYSTYLESYPKYAVIAILGASLGLLFTILDLLFTYRLMRFFPVRFTALIKSIVYFAAAFLILFAPDYQFFLSINKENINQILLKVPYENLDFIRFLVYFYFMCFLDNFFLEMSQKFGGNNFKQWISGVLNKPREEKRIFMFIDLKSSTSIAEKLQHKKFSHLVQDVFNDLAVVHNYGGEIYQYLGDGAIVSWPVKKGLKNANFLRAYFAVANVLKNRSRYYSRKYDLQPQFKAGAHIGEVMVLTVGQFRRDVSYNGDTMNTAARIESQCNELKQNLLISGELHVLIDDTRDFRFKNVGEISLRGKRKAMELVGVYKKSATSKKTVKKKK